MRQKWTLKETEDLKLISEIKTIDELTQIFNRSKDSIRSQCRLLGLEYKRVANRKNWSSAELQRLRALLKTHTIGEAAEILGRNHKAVWGKMKKEGIRHHIIKASYFHKEPYNKVWTQEDDDQLYLLAEITSVKNIAHRMERSPGAIRTRAMELGITWHKYRWTLKKVAELLDVGSTTVEKYRKKLKQKWRYKGTLKEPTEEEIQAIAQAILNNPRTQAKNARRIKEVARGDWDAWDWL